MRELSNVFVVLRDVAEEEGIEIEDLDDEEEEEEEEKDAADD